MSNKQEYVIFLSPGTFVDEVSERPIATRDTREAVTMAKGISERYGARPYGFYFETRLEAGKVRDTEGEEFETKPRITNKTGIYYIQGRIRTREDVEREGKLDERILASKMHNEGWEIVCETINGYRHTGIFGALDLVIDESGNVVERGDDQKWVDCRTRLKSQSAEASTG